MASKFLCKIHLLLLYLLNNSHKFKIQPKHSQRDSRSLQKAWVCLSSNSNRLLHFQQIQRICSSSLNKKTLKFLSKLFLTLLKLKKTAKNLFQSLTALLLKCVHFNFKTRVFVECFLQDLPPPKQCKIQQMIKFQINSNKIAKKTLIKISHQL